MAYLRGRGKSSVVVSRQGKEQVEMQPRYVGRGQITEGVKDIIRYWILLELQWEAMGGF